MTKDTRLGLGAGLWRVAQQCQAGINAYPGTMAVSLAVPTSGLPSADAQAYSSVLKYAAGPAQTPGTGNGKLPPGYVPMTAANGLGAMVSDTLQDAAAVAAQQGASPSPSPSPSASPSPSPSASPSTSPSAAPSPSAVAATTTTATSATAAPGAPAVAPVTRTGGTTTSQTTPTPAPAATPAAHPTPAPGSSSSAPPTPTVSLAAAVTPNSPVGRLGFLLPILLLVSAGGGTLALIVETVAAKVAR